METSENKFLDPEGDAITLREIPPADPPKVSKGYWNSVVRRVRLLEHGQVLRLILPPDTQVEGFRSSVYWAGTRAGRKLGVATRGSCVYVWDLNTPRPGRPPDGFVALLRRAGTPSGRARSAGLV